MSMLRSALKRVPGIRSLAWQVGKCFHHRFPAYSRLASRSSDGNLDGEPGTATTQAHPDEFSDPSRGGLPLPDHVNLLTGGPTFAEQNPVMSSTQVDDYGSVDFVADPFLHPTTEQWHLFFEVYRDTRDPGGSIGHATSKDGHEWVYDQVVLKGDTHFSFPYVFEWQGNRYMVPEMGGSTGNSVTLFEATDFPTAWRKCARLVNADRPVGDTVVFRWNDDWWLFTGREDETGLRAYHSDSLEREGWDPHPANPLVVGRPWAQRPGGRPLVLDDGIIMFFQDCASRYGDAVRAFQISELTTTVFEDRELPHSPILEGANSLFGWNSGRMHHIDAWYSEGKWFCAVDGNVSLTQFFTDKHWSIGTCTF